MMQALSNWCDNLRTRQRNIQNIMLSSHPDMISNMDVVPGMSDHEVIVFYVNLHASTPLKQTTHSVYLNHKGDLDSVRQDMLSFKDIFLSSNPQHKSVETNWISFKEALVISVSKHIPTKKYKSQRDLP